LDAPRDARPLDRGTRPSGCQRCVLLPLNDARICRESPIISRGYAICSPELRWLCFCIFDVSAWRSHSGVESLRNPAFSRIDFRKCSIFADHLASFGNFRSPRPPKSLGIGVGLFWQFSSITSYARLPLFLQLTPCYTIATFG
jgi:hypothetical protein